MLLCRVAPADQPTIHALVRRWASHASWTRHQRLREAKQQRSVAVAQQAEMGGECIG